MGCRTTERGRRNLSPLSIANRNLGGLAPMFFCVEIISNAEICNNQLAPENLQSHEPLTYLFIRMNLVK